MTRQLCGRFCFGVPRGLLNQSHVEKAAEMLEGFDAVLVAERLDESIALFEYALGWTDVDTVRTVGLICTDLIHLKLERSIVWRKKKRGGGGGYFSILSSFRVVVSMA